LGLIRIRLLQEYSISDKIREAKYRRKSRENKINIQADYYMSCWVLCLLSVSVFNIFLLT